MVGFESPGAQSCRFRMIVSAQKGSRCRGPAATPVALTAAVWAAVPVLSVLAALPWNFDLQL